MIKYESYKDSGLEWIGEIPSHWDLKRLKYVADSNPSNIDKKTKEDENEIFLCNYVDVYKNEFITSEIEFMKASASKSQIEKFILKKGDVIATKDSESPDDIAVPALVIEDFENVVCGYHLNHIKPKTINGFYLFRLFQSPYLKSYFETAANGVTRYGIGAEKFNNVEVLLPSPPEQTAIANYLDRKTAEIDELIADKKRLLVLYEEEKNAIINQAVTKGLNSNVLMKNSGIEWLGEIPMHWEVKRFKYYFNLITEKVEEDLPKIGLENIESKSGKFIETDTDFAGQGVRFRPKDILFGKLRPYLAKAWLSNFDGQAVGDFYVFRSKQEVYPEFAKYRILDSSFIEVTNSSTYGSKMPRVSWEFIADLPIAFPEIQEQQSIARHIETKCSVIVAKKAKTEKLIELLTEYRTALISEVVTGKVKVIE